MSYICDQNDQLEKIFSQSTVKEPQSSMKIV